ncbi:MAG: PEP-utilizing enzyme [Firmicutes bacterium]|nr:PEP-utilizing enzyme [Bacillota bacterium]
MAAYQRLAKIIEGTDIEDKEGFISSLFINLGGVESALSVDMFLDIAEMIKADESIKNDFENLQSRQLFDKYHNDSVLSESIKAYISKFGARVCDELKFETITMIQEPILLYDLLKAQIQNSFSRHKLEKEEVSIPNMSKRQKKKFLALTKKTAYFIRNRERLRLTRTHTFSAIRNILLRLGDLFFEEGLIDDRQDIFYLTKQEVFSLVGGKKVESIQKIVGQRKSEYEADIGIELPDRMVFFGEERLDVLSRSGGSGGNLTGIPSGAGKVTGKIKLVLDPKNADINGEIILAKRTDPGWITLFPLCSGLIVEYGSVLSHSAVVAREMGIPAVVGLKGATSLIKDGAVVTLDAIKGEVIVHE